MLEKDAITSAPIHDLLRKRWSPRAFDANRPVTRAQLNTLLEAARWSPSCNGVEPWRYLIWERARDAEGFEKMFDCLSDNNKLWVKNVPLVMLAIASSDVLPPDRPNRWTQYDTGMASACLVIQAVALGLITHQMAGYNVDKMRAAFSIPAEYTPMALIAVGYQADPDVLDDVTKKKELTPRSRKALGERFFEGSLGKPVQL
jgi:nitroreductase